MTTQTTTAQQMLRDAITGALPADLATRQDLIAALIDPAALPRDVALRVRAELTALPLSTRKRIQVAIKAAQAEIETIRHAGSVAEMDRDGAARGLAPMPTSFRR